MILEQTVEQVLRHKGNFEVYSICPDDTVYVALCRMAQYNVGALLVMEDEQIVGIVSERDYARRVLLKGRTSRTTFVQDVMSRRIAYVIPTDPIQGCLALMTENRIRHLPVLDDGKLIGLISMGDVVKAVISDQEFIIEQLVGYVTGSDYGWHEPQVETRATIKHRIMECEYSLGS